MKLNCPHCKLRLKIRTSRPVTALTRELYCQCENIDCAYTCKALVSILHTLTPSLNPDPGVHVPSGSAGVR